ncbi:MAG: hypothetical protein MJ247_01850 [Alphaproteobacteria bacterium]|nr:hypothetical protein [Alphaproteobacteria bacterium]
MERNLLKMVVCDKNGKYDTKKGEIILKDATSEFYTFYATSSQDQKPCNITLTMPVGGQMNGLMRLPKVGEKILVGFEGQEYYLIAYIPEVDANDFRKNKDEKDEKEKQGLILRYKTPNLNPKKTEKKYSEIKFSTEKTFWPEKKNTSSEFPQMDRIDIASSGDIINKAENYNEVNASRIGIYAGVDESLSKLKETIQSTDTTKENNGLSELPLDTKDAIPYFSKGDVQVRASNKIVLAADKGIEIRCGRSTITIDDTGIKLKSGKISSVYPVPDDSSITISPLSGVSVTGNQINMEAAIKYSISEQMGGAISSFGGATRINTHDYRVVTNCALDHVKKAVIAAMRGTETVTSLGLALGAKRNGEHGSASRAIYKYNDKSILLQQIGDFIRTQFIENQNMGLTNDTTDAEDTIGNVLSIMENIFTILPIIYLTIDTLVPEKKKRTGSQAYYDSINTINCTIEYSLLATFLALISAYSADGALYQNVFALTGDAKTMILSKDIQHVGVSKSDAASPIAAIQKGGLIDYRKLILSVGATAAIGVGVGAYMTYLTNCETLNELQEL